MEFITKNGQIVCDIKPASFKDAVALKKAVAKSLNVKDFGSMNFSDIQINSILELFIDIDTSDEFEKAIMECLKCCIYDKGGRNIKITAQVFDDCPEAREDYYEIITKCCEVNLRPFLKSLVSEFNNRLATIPSENQE